ncbi:MAG: alanine--tRNA ligase [Candidatus Sericytochromatia bacterium]|nr:alanine--tRNA ligase [Candidatus Sericytochromatia bacterium]
MPFRLEVAVVKSLTFKEIRQAYIDFFEARGHVHQASSSLVPRRDPTVLLTTAGMLQFKPIFMGLEKASHTRITTVQKCFRTTDLDNVGRTARHHTFFQMLGNFSFGDYFKAEVIPWAWEFLTTHLGIPTTRLWVSVFRTDDEAFRIWHEVVGVPSERIVRMDEADNFWAAGPTGPCGPCSEIYVDLGPEFGNGNVNARLGEDDNRFLEVWNLVFMEFNRDESGHLTPLPAKNIDTGMGLERIAAVLQGAANNFETDMLFPILEAVAHLAGVSYRNSHAADVSLKLITDHLRAAAFLIGDGVVPSNEGRGYVLRRIIRRAYRHGRLLGIPGSFLHTLVPLVASLYGDFYVELREKQAHITDTLAEEERRFGQTIDRGMSLLEDALAAVESEGHLKGATAFELYDTYGFPFELTVELAEERGIRVDHEGFEAAMEQQRERARSAREKAGITFTADAEIGVTTEFLGYESTEQQDTVRAVVPMGAGKEGVVLERTPFYAESGGQVGDTGVFLLGEHIDPDVSFANHAAKLDGATRVIPVLDTQKRQGAIVHIVETGHGMQAGDKVTALVNSERRWHIRRHHTATHLLHAALRQVLGTHVTQAGSLVGSDILRFDFSHPRALTSSELTAIETLVNEEILTNTGVHTDVMAFEQARDSGAMALFDEKYGDAVRVLSIGDFSKELCGGTHVRATGDIGLFKITSESGIAAGVRRIEAVAGLAAFQYVRGIAQAMSAVSDRLKAGAAEVPDRLDKLQEALRSSEKQVAALRGELAAAKAASLMSQKQSVEGIALVVAEMEDMTGEQLRAAAQSLLAELGSGVVLLAGTAQSKVSAVACISDDLTGRLSAGDLLKVFMERFGGRGSGRAHFAQGGGGNPEQLSAAVASAPGILHDLVRRVPT